MRIISTITIVLALAVAARAQSLPVLHPAQTGSLAPQEDLTRAFPVGDLTQDGRADYAVSYFFQFGGIFDFRVELFSGADGSSVRTLLPYGSGFTGAAIRAISDLNGDGVNEVALSVSSQFSTPVSLIVQDGATGAQLWQVVLSTSPFATTFETAGAAVAMSDLDADGTDDLAVVVYGVPGSQFTSGSDTRVRFLSGATGALIHEVGDPLRIIESIANAGDTNGDGFDDLVVAAPTSPFAAPEAGGASIISGADFSYLRFWNGDAPFDRFATGAVGAGDRNGDGFADVLISAQGDDLVYLYSGLDGSVIATFPLTLGAVSPLGLSDAPSFDWNGDGSGDLLVRVSSFTGQFEVRSGLDLTLLGTTNGIIIGDANGDGIADHVEIDSPSLGAQQGARVIAHKGAEPYGAGSGGLQLSWEPSSGQPSAGNFTLSGGTPGAGVLIAGSAQPTNEIIFGTTFPLLISALPQNLFLQVNANLNGAGELRAPVSLSQPFLAGTVLYYQWAELTPNLGTSNGLQLLFDS